MIYYFIGLLAGVILACSWTIPMIIKAKRKRDSKYYDDFLINLSLLPEKDMEKLLSNLRDSWQKMQKKVETKE